MLVRFFEQSDIFRFISLLLLIILLLGKSFFIDFVDANNDGILYPYFTDIETHWKVSFSIFFVFLQSIFIFFISNRFKLIKNDSILSSTAYIILMGLFPRLAIYPEFYLMQILFSVLIFIIFLFDREFYFEYLFWAGLGMGIISLINIQLTLLFIVIPIYLWLINRFGLRNLVIGGLGFLFPYSVFSMYSFVKYNQLIYSHIRLDDITIVPSTSPSVLMASLLVLIAIFSMIKVFSTMSRYMIQVRNYFISISIFSVILIILSFQNSPQYTIFAILPLSFLFARMIESVKSNIWKNIYFVSLFLFSLSQSLLSLNIL